MSRGSSLMGQWGDEIAEWCTLWSVPGLEHTLAISESPHLRWSYRFGFGGLSRNRHDRQTLIQDPRL